MKISKAVCNRMFSLFLLVGFILVVIACGTSTPAVPTATPPLAPPSQSVATLEPLPLTVTSQPAPFRATFPDPAQYTWEPVISGLEMPVDIQNAGDGSGRLFIVERRGQIWIFSHGTLLPEAFLDIRDRIESSGQEQGLLGLAFHPRYSENGYFYVNYVDRTGHTVIARFQVSGGNNNLANVDSEIRLLYVEQPYANHNGGGLVFGPDGYLYIGLGDGGAGGDPAGNGQSLDTLLGKILRIDINTSERYAIPLDNPFTNGGGLVEIWAYGLRNPWRFSFDGLTGELYIGDVGQGEWEEIDYLPNANPGGANFGWDYYEGDHPYESNPPAGVDFTRPIWEYSHGIDCSITGGLVYRGEMQAWQGIYLYADFCSGNVSGLILDNATWKQRLLFETGMSVSTFGQDEGGEIYLADYQDGAIFRLTDR